MDNQPKDKHFIKLVKDYKFNMLKTFIKPFVGFGIIIFIPFYVFGKSTNPIWWIFAVAVMFLDCVLIKKKTFLTQ